MVWRQESLLRKKKKKEKSELQLGATTKAFAEDVLLIMKDLMDKST